MSDDPAGYLCSVLDHIQQHSIRRDTVDWAALRRDALELAAPAQTTAETYPAIRLALGRLGDRHSFFVTPEDVQRREEGIAKSAGLAAVYPEGIVVNVFPDSPAAQAQIHAGDLLEAIDDVPLATLEAGKFYAALWAPVVRLRLRSPGRGRSRVVTLQAAAFSIVVAPTGHLELPAIVGSAEQVQAYAASAQRVIRELDERGVGGWVVDLRRNTGGNMWPMLAGAEPILGDGELGAFIFPENRLPWAYRTGQALLGPHVLAQVEQPYELKRPLPSVAVLLSRLTASSGELTALAFAGRPGARSFGEPTAGVPTANDATGLPDGAMVCLTIALGADRTGRTYEGPIVPDQPVSADWAQYGRAGDPVLQAAVSWVRREL
ncbi:MAG TPA: S41 family peptidase [Roseiflexaceae bacterium]|nr:S41 family peptidase [Roseiflexaceae bacterium]